MAVNTPPLPDPSLSQAPGGSGFNTADQFRAPGPGYTNNGSSDTSKYFSLVNSFGAGQALGPDIENYIKAIEAGFPKNTSLGGTLTIKRLSEPVGAHAIIVGDAAFILLFDALLQQDVQNLRPSSDEIGRAFTSFAAEVPKGTRLQNAIVVRPEDYSRVGVMADKIRIALAVANNVQGTGGIDIGILKDMVLSVIPDTAGARTYIDQQNPHAVLPRIDVGARLVGRPKHRNGGLNSGPDEYRDIAAFGGYVEILHPNRSSLNNFQFSNAPMKHTPLIHITNITSTLPIPGMVPLMLAIAANQLIERSRWLEPFRTYQKNQLNLGNLFPDPAKPGSLGFLASDIELVPWLNAHMNAPLLAVDISEGQWRIPDLSNWSDPDCNQKVYDQIGAFFGNLPLDRKLNPFKILAEAFTGLYGDSRRGGVLLDSRNIDYISLLSNGAVDPGAQDLTYYTNDPVSRAKLISRYCGGEFRSLYRTRISAIDGLVLSVIAAAVRNHVTIEGSSVANRSVEMDWATSMAEAYRNVSFSVSSPYANQGSGYSNIRYQ